VLQSASVAGLENGPALDGGQPLTVMSARTIEATFENGLLRPLEPIQDSDNQVDLVTILNVDEFRAKARPQQTNVLRGKYRGYLSSADEFSRGKQTEKTLEL
jgi:hypothetical protein